MFLIFWFPNVVCKSIIDEWLSSNDFIHVDTAICNRAERKCLKDWCSTEYFQNLNNCFGDISMLNWMKFRKTRMKSISLTFNSESTKFGPNKFKNLFMTLRSLSISNCSSSSLTHHKFNSMIRLCVSLVALHVVNVGIFCGCSVTNNISERTLKYLESFTCIHLLSDELLALFANNSRKLRKIEFGGLKVKFKGPFHDLFKLNPFIISIKIGRLKGFLTKPSDLEIIMNHCLNLESLVCDSYYCKPMFDNDYQNILIELIILRIKSLKYCNINVGLFRLMTSGDLLSVKMSRMDLKNPSCVLNFSGLSRLVKALPSISMVQYADRDKFPLNDDIILTMKDMLSTCPHLTHLSLSMSDCNLATLLTGVNSVQRVSLMFVDSDVFMPLHHSFLDGRYKVQYVSSVDSEFA
jgi:hypothetical protein